MTRLLPNAVAQPGKIITFYSYKGGTGRSMILANVAWVLASAGKRVLAVDWDLEAPGLHRYFYPFLVNQDLTESDGVIDIVTNVAVEAMTPVAGAETPQEWYLPYANILRYAASLKWEFPGDGALDFIPAGRQGPSYAVRVNSFDWQNFYERLGGGAFLEAVRHSMRAEYDYIVIDSRTGVSDTSGICTIHMPDILVVCYTLNNQGIAGAAAVAASAQEQRTEQPLPIFPIPMRIENSEQKKLELRQAFARSKFNRFLDHIPQNQHERYWGDIEVPYIPYYAYEEVLAAFVDSPERTLSLLASVQRITQYLTGTSIEKMPPISEERRQQIVALYEGTSLPPARHDFYSQVSLPANYIPRPEVLAAVRSILLETTPSVALTSPIKSRLTALHGMGGIGKSVIARALCDDPQVQAAFPDGILWATFGQAPNLIATMREWVMALGGTISEMPTIDSFRAQLSSLLRDRACLLVLDDVWRRQDAEALIVGGPRCRLLITTRDAEIARALGANVWPVPAMSIEEAVALLEEWAGDGLVGIDRIVKEQIVNRLGRLPLALKLAGPQLARRAPDEWLRDFDVYKLQLRRPETVHDSLEQTIGLSLDVLSPSERRLYSALAIFKEDEAIHETGIARLWQALAGLDAEATADLIDDLAARSLLEVVEQARARAVSLHVLLRDFLEAELGDRRLDMHRALLKAYRQTRTDAGWDTAPDDGYLYDHLAYHLDAVGERDELQGLFADQNWLRVRFAQRNYSYEGYLDDLMPAWARADAETTRKIDADQVPEAFAESVRYALIRTSVNSIAGNYIPQIVAQAVQLGVWTAERALSIAAQIPDPEHQVDMFVAILGNRTLSQAQHAAAQNQALNAVGRIESDQRRVYAIASLAPHLEGDAQMQALRQGLEVTLAILDKWAQIRTLAVLAPHLPERLLQRGLEAALALSDEVLRGKALIALAPHLSGALLDPALQATLGLPDAWAQARILAALAPHLSGSLLQQALNAVLDLPEEQPRLEALVELAPHLSGALLRQSLDAALATPDDRLPTKALVKLAPYVPEDQRLQILQRGLQAALALPDKQLQVEALAALAPYVPEDQRLQILGRGLEISLELPNEWARAEALRALAPRLSGKLLERSIEVALKLEDERARVYLLAALAPQLSGKLLEWSIEAALKLDDEQARTYLLAALAPQLSGNLLVRVLHDAIVIDDAWPRGKAFANLAAQLTGDAQTWTSSQGLKAAMEIRDSQRRADVLVDLAVHLEGEQKAAVLAQGLAAAQAIGDEYWRAEALRALAPQLEGALLAQGLATAQAIGHTDARALALAALAPQLEGEQRDIVLQQAVEEARVQDPAMRAQALAAIAPLLPDVKQTALLQQALEDARAVQDPTMRAQVLAAVAPQLTGEQQIEALQQGLKDLMNMDPQLRGAALEAFAPHLPDSLLEQALDGAQTIADNRARTRALAALALRLVQDKRSQSLAQGLAIAQTIDDLRKRAETLAAFLPFVQDQTILLKPIRRTMLDYLRAFQDLERVDTLNFCASKQLFRHPILPSQILNTIAMNIAEICTEWRWV